MRCWCWQGDHYEAGQYPRLMQMTSARVSAEVISRPPTISVSRPFQPRSPSIYDTPSTACLTRLQAPAMRGGQRIAEYVATAVVLVRIAVAVRVIATPISI